MNAPLFLVFLTEGLGRSVNRVYDIKLLKGLLLVIRGFYPFVHYEAVFCSGPVYIAPVKV